MPTKHRTTGRVRGDTAIESAADRILASRMVAPAARSVTSSRLRVLAYHGVEDAQKFSSQLEHLISHYSVVSSDDVTRFLVDDRPLPPRPVWITFDDARPTVLTNGLPGLARFGLPATMFVCPGVVDTDEPYWWDLLEAARGSGRIDERLEGLGAQASLGYLKSVDDVVRRRIIERVREWLDEAGVEVRQEQVTSDGLGSFVEAGGTVGNHTWDHPCLDTCTREEQVRQIASADEWLSRRFGRQDLFAYPNGNHSVATEAFLAQSGYQVAVLFDHRLTARTPAPFRLSRLRVNDGLSSQRFEAIVAGTHSPVLGLREGLRRLAP